MDDDTRQSGATTGSSRSDSLGRTIRVLGKLAEMHRAYPEATARIFREWLETGTFIMPDGWMAPMLGVWGSEDRPNRPNLRLGTPQRTTINLLPERESWRTNSRSRWALRRIVNIDRLRAGRKAAMTDPRYPFTDTSPLMESDTRIGVVRLYAKTEDLLRRGAECVEADKVNPRLEDKTAWVVYEEDGLKFGRYEPLVNPTRVAPAHKLPVDTNPGSNPWDGDFDTNEADKDRLILIERRKRRGVATLLVAAILFSCFLGWRLHATNTAKDSTISNLTSELRQSETRVVELMRAPNTGEEAREMLRQLQVEIRMDRTSTRGQLMDIENEAWRIAEVARTPTIRQRAKENVFEPLRSVRTNLQQSTVEISPELEALVMVYGAQMIARGRQQLLDEQEASKPRRQAVTVPRRNTEDRPRRRPVTVPKR